MKNFKIHLYYFLENEHLRTDLAVVKTAGLSARLYLRSTTTPRLVDGAMREVPVNEIRIKGDQLQPNLVEQLHHDDDETTWETE